jgi:hypothetical protein
MGFEENIEVEINKVSDFLSSNMGTEDEANNISTTINTLPLIVNIRNSP